jgi:hypothetical protein
MEAALMKQSIPGSLSASLASSRAGLNERRQILVNYSYEQEVFGGLGKGV